MAPVPESHDLVRPQSGGPAAVGVCQLETDAGKDYEFVGPGYTDAKWFGEGIGIAIRKEDDDLRKMFNEAIQGIRKNGAYQKINAEYFDFDVYGD